MSAGRGSFAERLRAASRAIVPDRIRRSSAVQRLSGWPPVGGVRFGDLGRTAPISRSFGFDRGQPIDRHYIEDFLSKHGSGRIKGRVLEVKEALYASRFGDRDSIEQVDILDVDPANPQATIVADLADAPELPSNAYDCVICTQTLLLIYDVRAAVQTLHRVLRPGGTILVTVPGISQIAHSQVDEVEDQWRFTTGSARRLFEESFDPDAVTVEAYGNVLSAAAFLYGLVTEDLGDGELDYTDPDYELLIGVKAVKR
jgi:SAM-dependent methyltransferase